MHRRAVASLAIGLLATTAIASAALTQRPDGWYGRSRYPPRLRPTDHRDEGFSFCRLMYASEYTGRGRGRWSTDYPFADINFMIRLSELTSTHVNFDDASEPIHWVVPIMDDGLFSCPFVLASAVGTMSLAPGDIAQLRDYLLKGGFLWVDDFWGTYEWERWASEIGKVLPPSQYPIVDLPLEHELFRTMFNVWEIPQISNIGFWRRSGGLTSERGADSAVPHFRAIFDADGRIMVAMTHNTDIQDAWEREGEDIGFFARFSPDGYALGINVLLHAMTH